MVRFLEQTEHCIIVRAFKKCSISNNHDKKEIILQLSSSTESVQVMAIHITVTEILQYQTKKMSKEKGKFNEFNEDDLAPSVQSQIKI